MKVKAQLHIHTNMDPLDKFIKYSPYDVIDIAAEFGFTFLSFTHHSKFLFELDWQKYAFDKWIILIPWVEATIKKKHVLIYNPDNHINNIKNLKELGEYKSKRNRLFVIAPHPFYPFQQCLRNNLFLYSNIFDGIEYSMCQMKKFWGKANKLASSFANKYHKPLIGTWDVHHLNFLSRTYCNVEVDFDTTNMVFENINNYIDNFFENIKKNNIELVSEPLNIWKAINTFFYFLKWRVTRAFK